MVPVRVREYCGGEPAAVMPQIGVKLWFFHQIPPSLSLSLCQSLSLSLLSFPFLPLLLQPTAVKQKSLFKSNLWTFSGLHLLLL